MNQKIQNGAPLKEISLLGSISVFLCSFQYASTHHGAQQGSPPVIPTCVRHGTYLRGGTGQNRLWYSKRTLIGIRRTNHQPIDRSGLTSPPVYGEAWASGTQQEPQTPRSPLSISGKSFESAECACKQLIHLGSRVQSVEKCPTAAHLEHAS
ncbi:hypothetical protein TNCV_3247061 [Trichonephila clavipes]|nr:hypothetical protein TNCV_3247061 [Trichonephila clavipes]